MRLLSSDIVIMCLLSSVAVPEGGGGEGNYFGVKRIGMTVGNPRSYPKKYQAIKFKHHKIAPGQKLT